MVPLPIDPFLPQITRTLRDARCLVLVAEPGAGKTTRVPPAILRAGLLTGDHPNLVMLQPRRVAARAAAARIAEENGWELGREAGYHVRLERRLSRDTRLRVLTEGILTRQLVDDPFLEGVGCVVLDEFHERSIHSDLALALLREVRQSVRDDLMIVVMSATLDAGPVARWLGGCPILDVPGRTFPVQITYATPAQAVSGAWIEDRVADAVVEALASPECGDVLAFLPGADEIRRTVSRIEASSRDQDLLVLPLHGSLPFEQQVRALRPAPRRKVICATNIAETSLTIDAVRTVIDSGLARLASYDPDRGIDRLDLARISRASATQRAGRAGRTAPGRCVRLWTEKEHHALADFELPEIRRVDLAGTVLALHAWGRPDPRGFGWFEPPAEAALLAAERLLAMLGALSAETDGRITELGRRMLALPVHPRLARLLLAAAGQGLAETGAAVAALLSEKDIVIPGPRQRGALRTSHARGSSDLLVRLDLLESVERDRFALHWRDRGVDVTTARQVARTRDELRRLAERVGPGAPGNRDDALLKLPLHAYPDRVCRRRASDPRAAAMVGGAGVRLAEESVVHDAELFVALDARHDARSARSESLVRVASAIDPQWLAELFPDAVRRERQVVFDESKQRVVARLVTYYQDLPLREDHDSAIDPGQAASVLVEALRPRVRELVEANEQASKLLARVDLLRRTMPEHPWPAFDDAELADVLTEAARGRRGAEELASAPLAPLLMTRLSYPLDRLLEQHAPETIAVPTGNRIRLQYAIGQPPVLAVRLQELFGLTDTPRVAGGRVPVTLHLLSPAYRPVQVTTDLKSFWASTYFQVRKDLRVRYPKHSWPEDPLTAPPQAKGGRRS